MMPKHVWSPTTVFGLDSLPEYKCIGWAVTQGRPCRNTIAGGDWDAATMSLAALATLNPTCQKIQQDEPPTPIAVTPSPPVENIISVSKRDSNRGERGR